MAHSNLLTPVNDFLLALFRTSLLALSAHSLAVTLSDCCIPAVPVAMVTNAYGMVRVAIAVDDLVFGRRFRR
jgi:hypothetical protein